MAAVIPRALAVDYDGTLATADHIPPPALEALRRARESGLALILVTGRTFFDLTRVCERLDLFAAVVAENGGVLYYPQEGRIEDLAPPPPSRLLAELDRRGLYHEVGRVVVGTRRDDWPQVEDALRVAGARLETIVNRHALMLLPAGIGKGVGLARALHALGISSRDVLGVGDAENDLDMLAGCGWRSCPGDAVPEVLARADWVFPGRNGMAVAQGIRDLLDGRLDLTASARHQLLLGWAPGTGEPVTLPERGSNLLIQGDSLSGKSWLGGALVEALVARRYSVCVIDPEGDYRVLDQLPGMRRSDLLGLTAVERLVATFATDPTACAVGDLSALPRREKVALLRGILWRLTLLRQRRGVPHWVLLDEAHLSRGPGAAAAALLDSMAGGVALATYRPSWLAPAVLDRVHAFVFACTKEPAELDVVGRRLAAIAPGAAEQVVATLPSLRRGEFVVVQRRGGGATSATSFVAPPRRTFHVRHLAKYVDTEVADPSLRFFFGAGTDRRAAASLGEFCRLLTAVPADVIDAHARRGDFSRWVADVFSDRSLARQIAKGEARAARGEMADLGAVLRELISERYGALPA